jgi:hypothetical protein
MGDRQEMSRYWVSAPKDYDPGRFQQRVRGELDLLFPAPPGRKIKWMSLGGYFAALRGKDAPKTKNEIWYAVNDSSDWKRVYQAEVPDWNDHWHYAHDEEVVLDTPADSVRVRYVGQPGVNAVRVNLHSLKPGDGPADATTVTHGYEMGGKFHERRFEFDGPAQYEIECPDTPKDMFIRFEVPSAPVGRK